MVAVGKVDQDLHAKEIRINCILSDSIMISSVYHRGSGRSGSSFGRGVYAGGV